MTKGDFRKYHIEKLKDINEAIRYLEVALDEFENDGDSEAFLMALRDVAEARGGISMLAKRSRLSRTSLYKTLSSKGNPKINTISTILGGLNLKIRLEAINTSPRATS